MYCKPRTMNSNTGISSLKSNGALPTCTILPRLRANCTAALIRAGTPVVSTVIVGPRLSETSRTASARVLPSGSLEESMTWVAPIFLASSMREATRSTPMMTLAFWILAPMMALRPTPPRPRMHTVSFSVAWAALMTVPVPVCTPQPSGARSWSSCLEETREVALTTEHSRTMEREAKDDWPKKAPGMVGLEGSSLAPKTGGWGPKFRSLKPLQCE